MKGSQIKEWNGTRRLDALRDIKECEPAPKRLYRKNYRERVVKEERRGEEVEVEGEEDRYEKRGPTVRYHAEIKVRLLWGPDTAPCRRDALVRRSTVSCTSFGPGTLLHCEGWRGRTRRGR
jgi:hypothetical protein